MSHVALKRPLARGADHDDALNCRGVTWGEGSHPVGSAAPTGVSAMAESFTIVAPIGRTEILLGRRSSASERAWVKPR